jgi:hypothetical protein
MQTYKQSTRPWWTSPYLWVVLALTSTLPFFFADIPPLTDLPNHIARYYIFLNIDHSPFLQNYYHVQWHLIGNLGIDLLFVRSGRFWVRSSRRVWR